MFSNSKYKDITLHTTKIVNSQFTLQECLIKHKVDIKNLQKNQRVNQLDFSKKKFTD
jgi:hypothetical protein